MKSFFDQSKVILYLVEKCEGMGLKIVRAVIETGDRLGSS